MVGNILKCFLLQSGFTVGMFFITGWLISLCNKVFYKNFGNYGKGICYFTGFIGTPVHELSHAFFCLIFGHKIQEIKLFRIADDGILGYVEHSYNKKNIYHRVGNFFIGIAPLIVISLILFLLARWLIPSFAEAVYSVSKKIALFDGSSALMYAKNAFAAFFVSAKDFKWWIFLSIGMFLSLHAALSGADIVGMLDGLIFVMLIGLLVDIVMGVLNLGVLISFTRRIIKIGAVITGYMFLMLIFSIFEVCVSFAFSLKKSKSK